MRAVGPQAVAELEALMEAELEFAVTKVRPPARDHAALYNPLLHDNTTTPARATTPCLMKDGGLAGAEQPGQEEASRKLCRARG